MGEANRYIQFGYNPLTILYHTQGQVSGLMKADPINMIQKSQQSAKESSSKDLEGDFRNSKEKYLMNK